MSSTRSEIISKLWHGADPFQSFPRGVFATDYQGWNSDHPFLTRAIDDVSPRVIVEVGVWKGGSVITMADHLKTIAADAVIIAIDTWLGSSEHWLDPSFHAAMAYDGGYPRLYNKFAANVIGRGLEDYVVPLPLDSVNAFGVLARLGIKPDILHIDAGHDFQSATNDLKAWWPTLAPHGVLIGDDYFADGAHWPEVKEAFDTFFGNEPTEVFEPSGGKVYVRKPG